MSASGHFRQIETLPALAACLLCPEIRHSASIKLRADRRRGSRRGRASGWCVKPPTVV